MKRMLALILALVLLIPAALAETATFEGPGFATPEEAVLAYLDAFNRGDVDGMLSTFAIESLVDHVDPQTALERTRAFVFSQYYAVPSTNDYSRNLAIARRYAELATALQFQYLTYCGYNGNPVSLPGAADAEAWLGAFDQYPVNDWTGSIEFVEWIDPLRLEQFCNAKNFVNICRLADMYGGDDNATLIAHIHIGGGDGILFMDAIRYGDRWYNLTCQSNPAIILGIASNFFGLGAPGASGDDSDTAADIMAEIEGSFNPVPDVALQLAQQSNRASGLHGARLPLMEVAEGLSDVTIVSSPAEAVGDLSGRSICAELHFMTYGGCLTLWVSPALKAELDMETTRQKSYFHWIVALGAFLLNDDNIAISNIMNGLRVQLNDLGLTLDFAR